MRFKIYISILFVLSLVACTKDVDTTPAAEAPVTLGFWVGDPQTRTSINSDGITTSWSKDDRVALWADLKIGESFYHRLYNKVEFDLFYRDRSTAMFTTEIDEVMPGDETTRYRYYATYPVPKSVLENLATFSLPAQQDGKIGNGAAIMVAYPDEAEPLRALKGAAGTSTSSLIKEDHLRLKMKHMMHALKFYVPSTKWGFDEGEKIDRIVFTMPQSIAGDVTLDYTNPDFAVTTTKGVKDIELNLAQPIGPSESASNLDFAAASIIPSGHSFVDGDQIVVKMYTQNQAAINYISLKGRTQMRAGHITPIGLDCTDARDKCVLRFKWGGNNLYEDEDEDVNVIRFYNSKGEQIYEITDVATFVNQRFHNIDFLFLPENVFHMFIDSIGQPITVEYESDHAIVTDSFIMPEITSSDDHEVKLTVPYLFFEDFSTTNTSTNYNDNPGTGSSNAGKTEAADLTESHSWPRYYWTDTTKDIGIWSGARCGLEKGKAVRICTRSENAVGWPGSYYGRLDSPNMGNLKPNKTVKLRIQFNYSLNREGSRTSNHNHYLAVGTHTTPGLIKASSGVGSWISDGLSGKTIDANVASDLTGSGGSFDVINNSVDKTIEGCTQSTRIVWEVYVDSDSDDGYYNNWVYLDNIKVQIAK